VKIRSFPLAKTKLNDRYFNLLSSGALFMMKHLLVSLGLLMVTAGMPIAPAIGGTELDRLVEQAKTDADAAGLPDGYEESASGSITANLVSIALKDGKPEEAIKLVKARREKYPNHPDSYSEMGRIKEEYLQDLSGALDEYNEARLKALRALEAARKKTGDSSLEAREYKEAIVDNSQKAVSILLTIADYGKNQQAFATAENLMKAADTYHKTAASFINRSRAIELIIRSPKIDAQKKESLKEAALKAFAVAIKARPNLPDAYLYQGIFKARVLKDNAGAKADLQKAYELSSKQQWKAGIDRSSAALKGLEQRT
jgi:hypothetical protein